MASIETIPEGAMNVNVWCKILRELQTSVKKVRDDPEFYNALKKFGAKIEFFVANPSELQNNNDFVTFVNKFGARNRGLIWDWVERGAKGLPQKLYKHFNETEAGYITDVTHHLFLYGCHLYGDKLIIGAYYNTTKQNFSCLVGNPLLSFCRIFIGTANGIGGVIKSIPIKHWKDFFSCIGNLCQMMNMDSISNWIEKDILKKESIDQDEMVLYGVMVEMLFNFLSTNSRALNLPLKIVHCLTYYICGEKDYLFFIKLSGEPDTLGLLPVTEVISTSPMEEDKEEEVTLEPLKKDKKKKVIKKSPKSPSKRKANDGAGSPIKKRRSVEDLQSLEEEDSDM